MIRLAKTYILILSFVALAGCTKKNPSPGAEIVTISGDITDAQAAAQIAAEVGPGTKYLYIKSTRTLTTLNIPGITHLTELVISSNTDLNTVILPDLQAIDRYLDFVSNKEVSYLFFPKLTVCDQVTVTGNPKLSSINFPVLTSGSFSINTQAGLSALSLPALATVTQSFAISGTSLDTVSLPSLTSVSGNFSLQQMTNLKNCAAAVLKTIGQGMIIKNTANACRVDVSSLLTTGNIEIVAAIDSIKIPRLTTAAQVVVQNTLLKYFSAPLLVTADQITFSANPSLIMVNLAGLNKTISGLGIAAGAIDLSSLTSTGSLSLSADNLVSLPQLASCNGDVNLAARSINAPLLTNCERLTITGTATTSINLNALQSVINLNIYNTSVSSLSLPALTTVQNSLWIQLNPSLTALSLPLLNQLGATNSTSSVVTLSGNKLSSSGVNAILHLLVSISPPLSAKNISLKQSVPAPPTGQGVTDKGLLVSRGNTVSTD